MDTSDVPLLYDTYMYMYFSPLSPPLLSDLPVLYPPLADRLAPLEPSWTCTGVYIDNRNWENRNFLGSIYCMQSPAATSVSCRLAFTFPVPSPWVDERPRKSTESHSVSVLCGTVCTRTQGVRVQPSKPYCMIRMYIVITCILAAQ